MARKETRNPIDLVAVQSTEITVQPPTNGVLGQFLQDTHKMFRTRGMTMLELLKELNACGQRTEQLLRFAVTKMESAETELARQLQQEGLTEERED